MATGVSFSGFLELTDEIEKMADAYIVGGGDNVKNILKAGAEPILQQAILNAPVRSGLLKSELKIKVRKKKARTTVRIGVHKGSKAYYATFVEYGHGGPHPAGEHLFIRPAFDAKSEEAYTIIKDELKAKLKQL